MPRTNWFGTSWSLTVEEWSYLALPLLAFYMYRSRPNRILWAALSLVAAGITCRTLVGLSFDQWSISDWDLYIRKTVVTRWDAVAYGVLARILVNHSLKRLGRWMAAIGLVLGIICASMIMTATEFDTSGWLILFQFREWGSRC